MPRASRSPWPLSSVISTERMQDLEAVRRAAHGRARAWVTSAGPTARPPSSMSMVVTTDQAPAGNAEHDLAHGAPGLLLGLAHHREDRRAGCLGIDDRARAQAFRRADSRRPAARGGRRAGARSGSISCSCRHRAPLPARNARAAQAAAAGSRCWCSWRDPAAPRDQPQAQALGQKAQVDYDRPLQQRGRRAPCPPAAPGAQRIAVPAARLRSRCRSGRSSAARRPASPRPRGPTASARWTGSANRAAAPCGASSPTRTRRCAYSRTLGRAFDHRRRVDHLEPTVALPQRAAGARADGPARCRGAGGRRSRSTQASVSSRSLAAADRRRAAACRCQDRAGRATPRGVRRRPPPGRRAPPGRFDPTPPAADRGRSRRRGKPPVTQLPSATARPRPRSPPAMPAGGGSQRGRGGRRR